MDVCFLMSIFRLYPGLKMSFEHNSVRKNLFLSACFCWDSRLSLNEMNQKNKIGGTIGYAYSYLEHMFCHSKVIRLNATLQDATGAVVSQNGKGPGYCYMIGQGLNSCLLGLGHVTGLLICLYIKLFLTCIFNSVDFCSSVCCIALDIELADKSFFEEMGVFVDGNVQRYFFCPPEKYKPTEQLFRFTRKLHGIV